MGYSGNSEPSFLIPTAVGTNEESGADSIRGGRDGINDLDFFVGDDVRTEAHTMLLSHDHTAHTPGISFGLHCI
jgi:hypothetical protein